MSGDVAAAVGRWGRGGTPDRALTRRRLALGGLFGIAAMVTAVAPAAGPATARGAIAAGLVALAAVQWAVDWRGLVVALAAWLVPLGFLRRLLTELAPRGGADPLLLVAPAALALLLVSAMRNGTLSRRSALTTAVLALNVMTLLEVGNLSVAPLVAGVAALLFVLVPQLAFWVGRVAPDVTLRATLRVLAVLSLVVAGYGLLQNFAGFFPWDRRWISEVASGYLSLHIGTAVRAFGMSTSSAEYAWILAIGIVCWLVLPVGSRWIVPAAVTLLATALVLASARAVLVLLVAAVVLVAAARLAVPGIAALLLVALALVAVSLVATLVVPQTLTASATSDLLRHQVAGLANPLDPDSSTLLGHIAIAVHGLGSVGQYPFGRGIAAITLGTKFGGEATQTEVDLSNTAVAFGPIGAIVFAVVLYLGFRLAYRTASETRTPIALAALGILVATSGQWLNGGNYAVAWLPWLLLGWLDRPATPDPATEAGGGGGR
jgi:hypothetical protein